MSRMMMDAVANADALFNEREVNSDCILIMFFLAWHFGSKTKLCYPSHHKLAKKSRLAKSTVAKCLRTLKRKGFIDWEQRNRLDSVERKSNMYVIHHEVDAKGFPYLAPKPIDIDSDQCTVPRSTLHRGTVHPIPSDGLPYTVARCTVDRHAVHPIPCHGIPSTVPRSTLYRPTALPIPWDGQEPVINQEENHVINLLIEPVSEAGSLAREPVSEPDSLALRASLEPLAREFESNQDDWIKGEEEQEPEGVQQQGLPEQAGVPIPAQPREVPDPLEPREVLIAAQPPVETVPVRPAKEKSAPVTQGMKMPTKRKLMGDKPEAEYDRLEPNEKLAWNYFTLLGKEVGSGPERYRSVWKSWAPEFNDLLERKSVEILQAIMVWAWEESWWQTGIDKETGKRNDLLARATKNPARYFVSKFPMIEQDFLKTLHRNPSDEVVPSLYDEPEVETNLILIPWEEQFASKEEGEAVYERQRLAVLKLREEEKLYEERMKEFEARYPNYRNKK